MRKGLHFGVLERLAKREIEYADVKAKTRTCARMGLKFGVSFYGPISKIESGKILYKRIELWCAECPSSIEILELMQFFRRHPPKQNNTCYAYYEGKIEKVENWHH